MHSVRSLIASTAAAFLVGMPSGLASSIRLEDSTTFNADVMQMNDDSVIIRLRRGSIATIDGKPLPAVLKEGSVAPAFSAQDIEGNTVSVGKTTGKITLLHFWVHWCPHCRSDSPKLQALYDEFRSNPQVQFATVNMDEQRSQVDKFVGEGQITYPVIFAAGQAGKPNGVDIPGLYQITGFPVTYLISTDGIIRYKFSGSFAETGKDIGKLITEMLPKQAIQEQAPKRR